MNIHQQRNNTVSVLSDYNNSKGIKAGKYWTLSRTRGGDTTYYLFLSRGNYFKVFKIEYTFEGEKINAFWFSGDWSKVSRQKTLILKVPKSKPKEFMLEYVKLTPDLCWFKSIEEDIPSFLN